MEFKLQRQLGHRRRRDNERIINIDCGFITTSLGQFFFSDNNTSNFVKKLQFCRSRKKCQKEIKKIFHSNAPNSNSKTHFQITGNKEIFGKPEWTPIVRHVASCYRYRKQVPVFHAPLNKSSHCNNCIHDCILNE